MIILSFLSLFQRRVRRRMGSYKAGKGNIVKKHFVNVKNKFNSGIWTASPTTTARKDTPNVDFHSNSTVCKHHNPQKGAPGIVLNRCVLCH